MALTTGQRQPAMTTIFKTNSFTGVSRSTESILSSGLGQRPYNSSCSHLGKAGLTCDHSDVVLSETIARCLPPAN